MNGEELVGNVAERAEMSVLRRLFGHRSDCPWWLFSPADVCCPHDANQYQHRTENRDASMTDLTADVLRAGLEHLARTEPITPPYLVVHPSLNDPIGQWIRSYYPNARVVKGKLVLR